MKIYLAIGDLSNHRVNLFRECGVERVLVSYAQIKGKEDIPLPFSDCMIDSGAFSVETRKDKISVRAYALWLQIYLDKYPQIKTYVNLDDLSDPEKSKENQEYMESEGLTPIPVYHYGEPIEYLDYYCNRYEYVGLGGIAVGTMSPHNLQKFWEWVYSRYPDNKFHIFGVGTMQPFFYHQPYSIDCSSWAIGRFGGILGYKEGLPHRFTGWERHDYDFFFTTEELYANNIRAILDWEKLGWLKCVPERSEQLRLFL